MKKIFHNHGFLIILCLCAIIAFLMFYYFGFWWTVLLSGLLILAAYAGHSLDRRMSFLEFIERLFKRDADE